MTLSKDRSSVSWINVCLFELGALKVQEFIARMTSCLSLFLTNDSRDSNI